MVCNLITYKINSEKHLFFLIDHSYKTKRKHAMPLDNENFSWYFLFYLEMISIACCFDETIKRRE
jgi:hypothetical protein